MSTLTHMNAAQKKNTKKAEIRRTGAPPAGKRERNKERDEGAGY